MARHSVPDSERKAPRSASATSTTTFADWISGENGESVSASTGTPRAAAALATSTVSEA